MTLIEKIASSKEKIFFTRYRLAVRSMLLTTLLPSITTDGILLKSLSNSTSWDTWDAASLPDAMAILQSASFNARISFTPSPVIATVFPSSFKACTKMRFCSGVTLPNTVYLEAARRTASSLCKEAASTYFSAWRMPAFFAISDTVTGLSPEMTFTSTPRFAK